MAALTTLAAVRQSVPRLSAVSDAEIGRLIDEASDVIQAHLNRDFPLSTYTETVDVDGTGRLFVRNLPITSITSVTVGLPAAPRVLDAATYHFDGTTGEIRGVSSAGFFPDTLGYGAWGFGNGFQTARIVYIGGYATVPAAVVGRCLSLVNRISGTLALDPSVASKTMGKVSYSLRDASSAMVLDDNDMRILSLFRRYEL